MEVRCERCRAQYVFADDQVGEHGLTVRCSNCGHLFKVKKKALVVTLPVTPEEAQATIPDARKMAVQVGPPAAEREWTLRQPSGQTYAFKDMTTLHRWIVERKAHREDEISRAGEPWRRLGSIPELQSFFAVVEAAERAAYAAPPPQPTMVQYPPPAAFPGMSPARPEQPYTPPPPRTEFAFPAQAAPAGRPPAPLSYPPPAPPRTEVAFPAAPPPPPTEVAFPQATPPAVPPRASSLEALFTPNPMPISQDPFAPRPLGEPVFSPPAGTEQGFPPAPATSAAPARPPSAAAWEGAPPAVPAATGREPVWMSADAQTKGLILDRTQERHAPSRSGGGGGRLVAVLAVVLVMAGLGAGAAWWFFLRQARQEGPLAAVRPPGAVAAPAQPAPEVARPEVPTPAATPPPAAAPPAEGQAAAPAPAPAVAAPAAPSPPPAEASPPPVVAAPAAAAVAPAAAAVAPGAATAHAASAPTAAAPPGARPAKAAPARPEPRGAPALLAQARRLRDRGRTQQALDLYGRAVALEAENAEALAGRGWCYLDLSQYGPAEASFESALEADGKSADALLGLAETYRYAGRRADAVRYYERYLAAHPDGEDAVAARNAIQSLKE